MNQYDAIKLQNEIIQKMNPNPVVIFDVGANIGEVTKKYDEIFTQSIIYCFEPVPDIFNELKKKYLNKNNIQCFNLALGKEESNITIHESVLSTQSSANIRTSYVTESKVPGIADSIQVKKSHIVKQTNLDSFCKKNSISNIHILKLDVEGSELDVLKGASELLSHEQIDLIYTEVNFADIYENQSYYHDLASFLYTKNYKLFDLVLITKSQESKIYWGEAIFISPQLAKHFKTFTGLQLQPEEILVKLQQEHDSQINTIKQEHDSQINTIKQEHDSQINTIKQEHDSQINDLTQHISHQAESIKQFERSVSFHRAQIDALINSKTWKLGQMFGKHFGGTFVGKIIEKSIDKLIKNNMTLNKEQNNEPKITSDEFSIELSQIMSKRGKNKKIIVYPPALDWNIPLYQRPQHMAQYLSNLGWLFFYCTRNVYDNIKKIKKLNDNLYISHKFIELLAQLEKFVLIIHSGDPDLTIDDIKKLQRKAIIVYDYLDEIHPAVSGGFKFNVIDRHNYLIQNSDIVIVTADKLFDEVKKIRNHDVYLLPNAVEYEHFHIDQNILKIPEEMKKIRSTKHHVIGYFGAIAKWFDYDLVKYLAETRKDLEIVLIGWDYDGSLKESKLLALNNIHYLGIKDYQNLPSYAIWFDVCILPFVLNEITHSTSPIKLFEYMALGKPIVTTSIKESHKYKSSIIAINKEDFLSKIDLALKLSHDKNYLEMVNKEAMENTWKNRFLFLSKIIDDHY